MPYFKHWQVVIVRQHCSITLSMHLIRILIASDSVSHLRKYCIRWWIDHQVNLLCLIPKNASMSSSKLIVISLMKKVSTVYVVVVRDRPFWTILFNSYTVITIVKIIGDTNEFWMILKNSMLQEITAQRIEGDDREHNMLETITTFLNLFKSNKKKD